MDEGDYDNATVRANGHTDLYNVVDSLWQAIRQNLNGLDYTQYWQHLEDGNHNLDEADGESSTFGGLPQGTILGHIVYVINTFRPRLSNTELVFESNNALAGRNFTTGQSSNGTAIANVRVMCNVNAIDDSEAFADQLGHVIVSNAYPIA